MPDEKPLSAEFSTLEIRWIRCHLDGESVISSIHMDRIEATIRSLTADRERLEAKLAILAAPGSPIGIVNGMFEYAEAHCGHNPYSAKHALSSIVEYIERMEKRIQDAPHERDCDSLRSALNTYPDLYDDEPIPAPCNCWKAGPSQAIASPPESAEKD